MVDVGNKPISHRMAIAGGRISMQGDTLALIQYGEHKKGDVLGIARIAGILGAKKTAELVPLCHPLALTSIDIEFKLESEPAAVYCKATVETNGQTGVEMEALTAASVAALTLYDMCKAVDKTMVVSGLKVIEKKGGRSGHWKEGRQ